jgi:hypothetical protein
MIGWKARSAVSLAEGGLPRPPQNHRLPAANPALVTALAIAAVVACLRLPILTGPFQIDRRKYRVAAE